MLDFSGLLDRATELLSGGNAGEVLDTDLAGKLSELGVDSSLLEGVQLDEVHTLLDNAGIDMSALNESQIGELLTSVQENGLDAVDLTNFFDSASR